MENRKWIIGMMLLLLFTVITNFLNYNSIKSKIDSINTISTKVVGFSEPKTIELKNNTDEPVIVNLYNPYPCNTFKENDILKTTGPLWAISIINNNDIKKGDTFLINYGSLIKVTKIKDEYSIVTLINKDSGTCPIGVYFTVENSTLNDMEVISEYYKEEIGQ